MRHLIAVAGLLAGLGAAARAEEAGGCREEQTIGNILALSNNLKRGTAVPTVSVARTMVEMAVACGASRVKVITADALGKAVSNDSFVPTGSIAYIMGDLCEGDGECVKAAIVTLGKGINPQSVAPTATVTARIAKLVQEAPSADVKSVAMAILSEKAAHASTLPLFSITSAMEDVAAAGR